MTIKFNLTKIFTFSALVSLAACGGGGASAPADPAAPFFMLAADNGVTGMELFRTDGTAAGTVMLIDLNAGSVDGVRGILD
jgi:ELWxxDGT repeat protein